MTYIREPTLEPVSIDQLHPTQITVGMREVEDKRKRQPPEFDKVKDQLESYVMRKAQVDLVTKLRSEAKIERLDKPAETPADKPAEPKKN